MGRIPPPTLWVSPGVKAARGRPSRAPQERQALTGQGIPPGQTGLSARRRRSSEPQLLRYRPPASEQQAPEQPTFRDPELSAGSGETDGASTPEQ
eukprot:10167249-Alexandrium_andersonii.AAC.1